MNSDELLEKLEKQQAKVSKVFKQMLGFNKTLFVGVITYSIMLWIFLYVYDNFGWHRTLISLGVGIIIFGIRQMWNNAD